MSFLTEYNVYITNIPENKKEELRHYVENNCPDLMRSLGWEYGDQHDEFILKRNTLHFTAKWYDRIEEMYYLTISFPQITVRIRCSDEAGDEWTEVYKNGSVEELGITKIIL